MTCELLWRHEHQANRTDLASCALFCRPVDKLQPVCWKFELCQMPKDRGPTVRVAESWRAGDVAPPSCDGLVTIWTPAVPGTRRPCSAEGCRKDQRVKVGWEAVSAQQCATCKATPRAQKAFMWKGTGGRTDGDTDRMDRRLVKALEGSGHGRTAFEALGRWVGGGGWERAPTGGRTDGDTDGRLSRLWGGDWRRKRRGACMDGRTDGDTDRRMSRLWGSIV